MQFIPAQLRLLEAFAIVKGCDAVETFVDDGFSGKNLRRPAIQRLIARCQESGLDYIMVWRLDRLSRSLRDTLALEEDIFRGNGIQFISTSESIDTSTPSGRLMLNLLASVAQNEREVNEERVRMVCNELAKECRHMGGVPPYGYRVEDGRYVVEPREAETVLLAYKSYDKGMSGRRIQDYLTEQGYLNREGKQFSIASLHDMRRNEKYNGTYVYNRTVAATRSGKRNNHASKPENEVIRVPGGMPVIVPMDIWRKVQDKMDKNQHTGGRNNAKAPYLL
ncbi:MAG: recombinase family protein, partial [Clostridia bacterium]